MIHKKLANQILSAAKQDQELRFQVFTTNDKPALWKKIEDQDVKTTKMMQEIVSDIGWPTISRVGRKASHAAWLLVQHADKTLPFQIECLRLMQTAAKNEVKQQNIAFLTDRIAVAQGKKQIYGTQFIPSKNNPKVYVPQPIENIKNVDERRKSMGLNTLLENTLEINERKPEGTKQSSLE